ncbi:MAG TPA: SAM-dependent methyltransferase [Candidatus Limnocylindrales bacterium]|nr:SAM-dependent methyltransferase [Candidatus Limnocylindrales bacterium]
MNGNGASLGLRRVPPPDLDAVGSDAVLEERIRAEIAASGPITFAHYMEIAQYDPERGYYRVADARPGRGGDFLTAPEAHPIFGHAVSRQIHDVWQRLGEPDPFVVREYGAGAGALAAAVLDGLAADGSGLGGRLRYRAVEVDRRRLDELTARLAATGHAAAFEPDDGAPITGVVVANEVLDALPFHRVVARGGRLREVRVGIGPSGRLEDVEGDPSTPALEARLDDEGIRLADDQQAEICLALDSWVATAASGLARGLLLLIDYGHPAAELYDGRRRPHGTLAAYVRHTVHEDPYRHVGRQDLTAHVDVTAVERAAARAGLDRLGVTTQGEFLASLDAGELLVALGQATGTTVPDYLTARSALARMIDPAAMGRFRVMLFGRGLDVRPPLRGLTVRVRRGT